MPNKTREELQDKWIGANDMIIHLQYEARKQSIGKLQRIELDKILNLLEDNLPYEDFEDLRKGFDKVLEVHQMEDNELIELILLHGDKPSKQNTKENPSRGDIISLLNKGGWYLHATYESVDFYTPPPDNEFQNIFMFPVRKTDNPNILKRLYKTLIDYNKKINKSSK